MKSQIEKKNNIDFDVKLKVTQEQISPEHIRIRTMQLMNVLPDTMTKKEIEQRVNSIISRELAHNVIMDYLSKQYTYKISESELKQIQERVKADIINSEKRNNPNAKFDEKVIDTNSRTIASRIIIKTLIYDLIAKENNIEVSDEELNNTIENYKKETGQPADVLSSEQAKEETRMMIKENKVTSFLLSKFKNIEFPKLPEKN